MTRLKVIFSALALSVFAGTGAHAAYAAQAATDEKTTMSVASIETATGRDQQRDEYSAELRKYFTLSGTDATFPVMMETMIDAFSEIVNPEELNGVIKIIRTTGYEKLIEMFEPAYRKYLNLNDLKEINKFYESRAGRNLAASLPQISAEAADVGQQWAMYLLEILQEE